jgi:hypothetical protein
MKGRNSKTKVFGVVEGQRGKYSKGKYELSGINALGGVAREVEIMCGRSTRSTYAIQLT